MSTSAILTCFFAQQTRLSWYT